MNVRARFDNVLTDVRLAVRSLRRSPGFAAVAILALTVGIGGNTAIFSVIDATRTQAIPYSEPQQLVYLIGTTRRAVVERRGASYPDFVDWRAQSTRFDDLAAFDSQLMTLAGTDESERIDTEFVSASYFSLLGVRPALGRTFDVGDDDVSKPAAVVVLSDGLWRRRFGADPQVVGHSITLNGQPYTVVGVMAPAFTGVTDEAQLWIPFAQYAPPRTMLERGNRGFTVLGRLKPGVTHGEAQAELDAIASRLERAYPGTNEGRGVEVSSLATEVYGPLRLALQVLMGAIALVLVIACTNVANLLIARSEARRREIALRVAIGAGRGRLLQQLVTESCVLTLLGAAASIPLAQATIRLLVTQSPVAFPSILTPALDARMAAFTTAVALICGLCVGVAPWWQVRFADLAHRLRESSRSSDGPASQRLRNSLVVAEVALAVVLLVGAGLMIQSVRKLSAIDPGFDSGSLLTVHVSVPRVPRSSAGDAPSANGVPAPPVATGRELLDGIASVPGVVSVGLGNDVPLDGNAGANFYSVEGQGAYTAQDRPRAWVHRVSPEFFEALRISLVAGRTFLDTELTPTPNAVVVSERVATRFWPDQDPIGKRLTLGSVDANVQWLSVVGVVRDVRYRTLARIANTDPDIYLPFADRNAQIALAIRTSVSPSSVVASVRAAIRAVDASIAIYDVESMKERVYSQSSRERFTAWVMSVFASIALCLCALGIYGVMSYVVTQRTREIGIRLALGAQPRDVLQRIVGGGARLVVVGMAIGGIASIALRRLMGVSITDVPLSDPASGVALLLFALVGLAACLVPGVRATRLDPVRSLHQE
ncbi:MAG TPA: ABC transporter permease [Vicinamibacterales bacterium]|nr:ABC transporter permease [Vicinamibacterales bacterium]